MLRKTYAILTSTGLSFLFLIVSAFQCWANTITSVDTVGDVGHLPSIAIGTDGFPIISYYDYTNKDLKVAKCSNEACTLSSITSLDTAGDVGVYTSIAIGADGFPVISYYDVTNADLKVAKCNNEACTASTTTSVDTYGNVGYSTSIAIGTDGFPVISYHDVTNADMKLAKCNNSDCTAATITAVDTAGTNATAGYSTSIATGKDGVVISYIWGTGSGNVLKVARCINASCTSSNITSVDAVSFSALCTSIAIGADGFPVISYFQDTHYKLKFAKCNNSDCTTATITTVDTASFVNTHTSIAIGADGLPIISYYDYTNKDLKVAKCNNAACTSSTISSVDTTGDVGYNSSIAIGSDGLPVISYLDGTNRDLKVAKCSNSACAVSSTPVQYTLTTTKSGNGAISSSPSGINCGGTCSAAYNAGTSVTLTAAPDSGYTFTGWSGGGCSGAGACTVTVNSDVAVTATFTVIPAATNNCAASLTTELSLHIPILTYSGSSYWADFLNVPNTLNFTLTNANTVSDTSPYSGCTPASLSSDSKLHVPVIMFNGVSYWADFLYTGGVNFSFVNAGGN